MEGDPNIKKKRRCADFFPANFTSPSFSAVYSQWYPQYPSPIEVSAALAPNAFTVAQLKLLLTGPYGILNLQNFGVWTSSTSLPLFYIFLFLISKQLFQAATDLSLWGVDQTQASFFVFYMSSSDLESYTKPIVTAFVNVWSLLLSFLYSILILFLCRVEIQVWSSPNRPTTGYGGAQTLLFPFWLAQRMHIVACKQTTQSSHPLKCTLARTTWVRYLLSFASTPILLS